MRNLRDRSLRAAIHLQPQIIGDGIAVGLLLNVATHAGAKRVFAHIGFQRADDRGTLLVGYLVERLQGLQRIDERRDDRVRALAGIELHGLLPIIEPLQPDAPFRMKVIGNLAFHPGREALVEPQIIPPLHGDQIPEPLMCHLVRRDDVSALAVAFAGDARVHQHLGLPGENRAPVLHGAKGHAGPGTCDEVELWQRKGRAEVVVVVVQDIGGSIEHEVCLRKIAALDHHADVDAVEHHLAAVAQRLAAVDAVYAATATLEITRAKEQQVRGHAGRGREVDVLQVPGQRFGFGHGHVRQRHEIGRQRRR